ncbi:MAG: hypothetical protein ACT4PI_17465 [Actinomycetota bacterium]
MPAEELDTGWPPVLVAGAILLVILAVVAMVVVLRQARAAARATRERGRRTE